MSLAAADNTSAFNCRFVAGTETWSEHAYGRAIDVNPIENPYVTAGGYVSPPAGTRFSNRSRHAQGMIHRHGPVVEAFAAGGWAWGGNWPWPRDYQHFRRQASEPGRARPPLVGPASRSKVNRYSRADQK